MSLLDDIKELFRNVTKHFMIGRVYYTQRALRDAHSKEELNSIWDALETAIKEQPEVIAVKAATENVLEATGYDTPAALAGGVVGKGISWGVHQITQAALKNIQPVLDDFYTEFKIAKKRQDEINAIAGSGEFGLNAVVGFMLGHFLSPVLSTSLAPVWETMGQKAWQVLPNHLADVGTLIRLKYRGLISDEMYTDQLRKQGVGTEVQQAYEDGYLFYPAPTDLVTWLAKEVFEPEMITKYGLDDELPTGQLDLFEKAGVDMEQMTNYWRAHWEHPGWSAVREMLFRTDMTEADVKEWFRVVEIPPYWRDKYTDIMYTPITRVDLRRMWDLRVIDETRLKKGYTDIGYNDTNADLMTLWTKVYVEYPDLIARWKNGWISVAEVRSKLTGLGMPEERVGEFIEMKIKKTWEGRTESSRDALRAEIIKGVEKGTVTYDQGVELLADTGYEPDEAEFVLSMELEKRKGSPETFWEFKKLTELEKKATKKKGKVVPETLIEAEKAYRKHPDRTDLETEYREEMQKWEGEE